MTTKQRLINGYRRFPDNDFPGQTIPGQDLSWTITFPDRPFPDSSFPDKLYGGIFMYIMCVNSL